jgi:transcriptional regulator with XRE-family HTH domain
MDMTSNRRWAAFASRLKKARRKAGLSAREAATKVEVGYATYSKWELGTRMPADIDQISTLATALAVKADWLAFGTGEADDRSIDARLSKLEADVRAIRQMLERVFRA